METADNELIEEATLPDERVARFEQLLDKTSELELTETMGTVCGVHKAAFRVYLTVLDHPHSTITEIAEIHDRDKSTIGKQMRHCMSKSWSLDIRTSSPVVASSICMSLNHSQKPRSGYSTSWIDGQTQ